MVQQHQLKRDGNPKNIFSRLKNYLITCFFDGTLITDYNIIAVGVIGGLGHPVFYILHHHFFGQQWKSFILSMFSGFTCGMLLTKDKWPKYLKPFLPFYWHFCVTFALPFLVTLIAIGNGFVDVWPSWEIAMIFSLALLVPNWLIFSFEIIIGFSAVWLCHVFFPGYGSIINQDINYTWYFCVMAFAIVAGSGFATSILKGSKYMERNATLKSFAGSIAHELRNPLNAVNLAISQLPDLASQIDDLQLKKNINQIDQSILTSVKQANNTINIILADISEKPITEDQFSYLSADKFLPQIIDSFGYKSFEEKSRVKIDVIIENNFIFKTIPDRFIFIIYNLLKNSLFYAKEYPDLTVNVGLESRIIDDKSWNVIYVKDNGPGIPPEVLGKLFGDFFTSGKKEGTGLGLAFCKRNMQIFGGDIICESEYGGGVKTGWTKFSLLLPVISAEEIKKAQIELSRKKILLVDDQKTNLEITKSRLEAAIPAIICDTAINSEEALKLIRQNHYHLILLDIQMPGVSGTEIAKKIKEIRNEIPIIAFTNLKQNEFDLSAFNYYLSKADNNQNLYRNISKWLTDIEDGFAYLGHKEDYLKSLQGKKIILADDEQTNRMLTKRFLETNGLVVTEVSDGKQLLEIYQKSLNQNGKSAFDMILTDINMPPFNGDEAAKQIRKIEAQNNITTKDEIPIIALSGDGQKEDIHYFFRCKMTDYFIKGTSQENLIKIIANYLAKKDENQDFKLNKINNNSNNSAISSDLVNQNQSVIDLNHISSFKPEEQKKIINLFNDETVKLIDQTKQAIAENNKEQLLFCLKTIKGNSGNIGAKKMNYFLGVIESMIIESGNLPKTNDWANKLEELFKEIVAESKKLVK